MSLTAAQDDDESYYVPLRLRKQQQQQTDVVRGCSLSGVANAVRGSSISSSLASHFVSPSPPDEVVLGASPSAAPTTSFLPLSSRLIASSSSSSSPVGGSISRKPHSDPSSPPAASAAAAAVGVVEERVVVASPSSPSSLPRGGVDEDVILRNRERSLLDQVNKSLSRPLVSVRERAKGIVYSAPMTTGWRPLKRHAEQYGWEARKVRRRYFIDVQGEKVPPPVLTFEETRMPEPILKVLKSRGIVTPSQIQMQGLPVALSGRDMMGIAFTGSGKTIVFALPMVMRAMEYELKMAIVPGEGPFALCVCPSRELANQTTETIRGFTNALQMSGRYPAIRSLAMIGGVSVSEQASVVRNGVHIVTATPGRLNDFLNKRFLHLRQCKLLVMDESDRVIDLGFEEEIRNVLDRFGRQRQTLLFSATMPSKMKDFATSALVCPVIVSVGRAGAANLDVIQEVEYVKQDMKLPYLLECLQKTAPPVVIFCANKSDVDMVHEYLLLKGVEAVAIHAGLPQAERTEAIKGFKSGAKDILVGTDVASKGLDFPTIQHVINFDMPKEIENYVHRIGRTGRCGNIGIATTFVNKDASETVLLDLRALLIEAGQKVPPFLNQLNLSRQAAGGLDATEEIGGVRGCAFCGGLGHRILDCPKLDSQARTKQAISGGGGGGGGSSLGGAGGKMGGTGSTADADTLILGGSRYGGTASYGGDW